MANKPSVPDVESASKDASWFTRPLSGWWCALGWLVGTGVFFVCLAAPGGPAVGDAYEIIYPTWAVTHGQFACMYPPHPASIPSFASPVFPLITGAVGFVGRIGASVPFPSGTALGHNCDKALHAMVQWSIKGGTVFPTLWSATVVWAILMAGLVLLLRAAGRGRCGWEPTAVIVVAALPPVWMCIEMYAHPQDLAAMGFALAAMAFALRDRWIGAGIFCALAVLTQPFGILVAIPLFVVAPAAKKLPLVLGAAAGVAVINLPLLALTSGSAVHSLFLGSGNAVAIGSTVLWQVHLPSSVLVQISRIAPLVGSLLLAWFVQRRLGSSVLQPRALISLVAVSLSLRLVFEDNLFAYYFMALAVILVVLDVQQGRIRESLVAWLAMVTLVYSETSLIVWRHSWGQDARLWIPVVVMVVGLLLIIRDVLLHTLGWNAAMWAAAVITALIMWPESSDPFSRQPAQWVWQVVLVGIGVALAAGPLVTLMRWRSEPPSEIHSTDPKPAQIEASPS